MEYLVPPIKTQINPLLVNRLQNRLRFKHLALMKALGECGTLNLAAEELNITQPAATKLLKDLESTLGVKLFERHSRGMLATPLGESVVAHARLILGQVGHFTADLDSKRSGGHGFLSVGAIMGAAPDLISPVIAEMKARYPRLTVRLLGDTSDQIMALLESHQIELGVCRYIAAEQHAQFSFEPLGNEDLLFVASPGHPLARKRKLSLADLIDETWVMQPLPIPTRVLLEEEFARFNLPRPARLIECSSVYASLQVLQDNQAVALLSEPVVRGALAAGQITRLRATHQGRLANYGLVVRRSASLSATAEEFANLLRVRAAAHLRPEQAVDRR
jgi:DNA-binding transcriptional LysR family regulator